MGENTKYRPGPRIIGIVTAANRNDPQAWKALAECDLAEFRADFWDASRMAAEARAFREECLRRFGRILETIFTIRLARDGGSWPDADAAGREKVWLSLGLDGDAPLCDWIDLEVETISALSPAMRAAVAARRVKVLASHHNLRASYSRPQLDGLGRELRATGSDGVKLAVTCRTRAEVEELLAFARDFASAGAHGAACVLSMGAPGRVTRVLTPMLGCPLTYGYLTGGAVAPGQLSVRQLRKFYADMAMDAPGDRSVGGLLDWAEARLTGEAFAE